MIIKTYDAFTRLSFLNINRITNFLHQQVADTDDDKSAIRKSLLYAAKEIPSLGGYAFVMEENEAILGAIVINKTGMSEYQSENLVVYLAVHKDYRNKGIATKLLTKAITYCTGNIAFNIPKENSALSLLEKNGFKSEKIQLTLNK